MCETVKTETRSRNFSTLVDFLPSSHGLKFYLPDGNWIRDMPRRG